MHGKRKERELIGIQVHFASCYILILLLDPIPLSLTLGYYSRNGEFLLTDYQADRELFQRFMSFSTCLATEANYLIESENCIGWGQSMGALMSI